VLLEKMSYIIFFYPKLHCQVISFHLLKAFDFLLTSAAALPHPQNIPVSILHSLFVKGDMMGFELGEDDLEASGLYPDLEFRTIDQLLDIFLTSPPDPAAAAFE
jgi:hypothetical protein